MTKIAHAWIRETKLHDYSKHRVGCIVAKRISPDKARVAFSLCCPGDKMDLKKAKRLAIRRLTEFKSKSIVIEVSKIDPEMSDWASCLGIDKVVEQHWKKYGRLYAESHNQRAFFSLFSDI